MLTAAAPGITLAGHCLTLLLLQWQHFPVGVLVTAQETAPSSHIRWVATTWLLLAGVFHIWFLVFYQVLTVSSRVRYVWTHRCSRETGRTTCNYCWQMDLCYTLIWSHVNRITELKHSKLIRCWLVYFILHIWYHKYLGQSAVISYFLYKAFASLIWKSLYRSLPPRGTLLENICTDMRHTAFPFIRNLGNFDIVKCSNWEASDWPVDVWVWKVMVGAHPDDPVTNICPAPVTRILR